MSDADATPTPEPPRRRWGRRILLGVLGLLALVVLAVVVLLRTDAGLDVIRGVAVDVANDTLRGEVRIRRLHGDALSTLHLEGLEVRPDLVELYLQGNYLTSFRHLHAQPNLKEMHVENNSITSFLGAVPMPRLERVWLTGNPICQNPSYRLMCLMAFGTSLRKVN